MKKMVGRRVLGFAMASVMAMGMGTAAMAEETTYPMDTDATFVYWGELNGSVSANFNSLAEEYWCYNRIPASDSRTGNRAV